MPMTMLGGTVRVDIILHRVATDTSTARSDLQVGLQGVNYAIAVHAFKFGVRVGL